MNGQNLVSMRYAHNLSQTEFADLLNISRRTLGKIEQSAERIPPKYLARLKHLGFATDDNPPERAPTQAFHQPPPFYAPPPPDFPHSTDDDEDIPLSDNDDDDNSTLKYALKPLAEPFTLDSIPGNLFRAVRQKLEVTISKLVKLSGQKLSDVENAESTTALVSATLFEALVTASDIPTLHEPDTFLAYLADAVQQRNNEPETKPQSVIPAFSAGNGKDATAIEAVHYKWAYDRVSTELNDLKAEHRDVSRLAAERLAKVHELQRELDRLHVQQTLGDELEMQYAEDIDDHKARINADFQSQQDRFLAAKTTALEMLPAMMPIFGALAQNFRPKGAEIHNSSQNFLPSQHPQTSASHLYDPVSCETGHCTPPPAQQRPPQPQHRQTTTIPTSYREKNHANADEYAEVQS